MHGMALLIKNGEIITADARRHADIYCEGETITRIEPNIEPPPGTEVIDQFGAPLPFGGVTPRVRNEDLARPRDEERCRRLDERWCRRVAHQVS